VERGYCGVAGSSGRHPKINGFDSDED
jgi:hypothetical protein